MKTFTVTIPTTGYVTYLVTAASEEAAIALVQDTSERLSIVNEDHGDWYTSDPNQWDVQEQASCPTLT